MHYYCVFHPIIFRLVIHFNKVATLQFTERLNKKDYYSEVKMFPLWRSGDKIVLFRSSRINKLFPPPNTFGLLPVRFHKLSDASFDFLQFDWLKVVTLKASNTTFRVDKYQYNYGKKTCSKYWYQYNKTLIHWCEWKSYLIQPLTENIPSQTSPRGIIPGLKVEPFITMK